MTAPRWHHSSPVLRGEMAPWPNEPEPERERDARWYWVWLGVCALVVSACVAVILVRVAARLLGWV